LFVFDYRGAFAEWEEWGYCCGVWWDGFADGFWSSGRCDGSFAGYDLVGHYFYGDVYYSFGVCFAAWWVEFCAAECKAFADAVAAGGAISYPCTGASASEVVFSVSVVRYSPGDRRFASK
jgi:hypothetical protein